MKREKKKFPHDPKLYVPDKSRKKYYNRAALRLAEKIGLEKAIKIMKLNPKAEVKRGTFHKTKGDHPHRFRPRDNGLYHVYTMCKTSTFVLPTGKAR